LSGFEIYDGGESVDVLDPKSGQRVTIRRVSALGEKGREYDLEITLWYPNGEYEVLKKHSLY